jgi:ribonuclease R
MNLNPTAQLSKNNYENPIPGREFILSLLGTKQKNLHREQIANALSLNGSDQKEALRRRLRAMVRDGQLLFNQRKGYQKVDQNSLIKGVVAMHPDGFGFVNYSASEKDLFLPKNQLTHIFDGDTVQVLNEPTNGKRTLAKLLNVCERKTTHIAGLLKRQGKNFFLIADNNKIPQQIVVESCALAAENVGKQVNTEITHYPNFRQSTKVKITEVLGQPDSAGMETKLALHRHGITDKWSDALLKQARSLGDCVSAEDKKSRVDYRLFPFVTIDGADAKDFDDAVYCERTELGEWRLLVAIADVSHYVKANDLLDLEAQERGTSIYCPGQVIPMLPEALSNGLCSLNPNEDRLVLVCDMTINDAGKVTQSEFTEGVIHSHARLTYDQAHAIVAKPNSAKAKKVTDNIKGIASIVQNLHFLYEDLIAARKQRGAIEFETQELILNLTKNRKISSIEPVKRNDAHRMIEEFMLCANVATAQFLDKHKIAGLYRVHAGPQQKKLAMLRSILLEKGLQLGGGDKPTSAHYNQLLTNIAHRADASVIRTLLLRSQSQAEYSPNNDGHFGLAYDAYAHFTSPIRRYPDLITHRAIRAKIRSQQPQGIQKLLRYLHLDNFSKKALFTKAYPYDHETIESLGVQCSALSRRADDISREVESALKCQYMEKFVGDSFVATISAVTNFGFFVELDKTGIEGLVPLSSFSQGEYVHDVAKQQWVNKKQTYSLGDRVNVILKNVDLRQRKMDFVLSDVTFH